MKILTKIDSNISLDPDHAKEQYNFNLYQLLPAVLDSVRANVIPGSTVVLFSGSPRFDFDATYIEPKMFSQCDIAWKPNTIFIDPSQTEMLDFTLKKLAPTNLLILHSVVFMQYRQWHEIHSDIKKYKNFAERVIVSLPLDRFEFHRLKYTSQDIAKLLGGSVIEDSVVVCQ